MLSRRSFFGALMVPAALAGARLKDNHFEFQDSPKFKELLASATQGNWKSLNISDLMGHVGLALCGTPYVGSTLDHHIDEEKCIIDLAGLDCVTFFEDTLDFSRMLLLGGSSEQAMLNQVQLTRYRSGHNTGYTSRLHYTMDWIHDNVLKHVVSELTPHLPGAVPHRFEVNFMSTHADKYPQLKAHPDLIPAIRHFEELISKRNSWLLPIDRIADAEPFLKTGDIIGIGDPLPGLDIAHTGLVYVKDGEAHFMDATSVPSVMKVELEGRLSTRVARMEGATGIVVARPLAPSMPRPVASSVGRPVHSNRP